MDRLSRQEVLDKTARGVYREDPAQWVPDATGYTLDAWQADAFRRTFNPHGKRKIAISASVCAGKTLTAALAAHFFLANYMPSKTIVTGPTGKQVRLQFGHYLREILKDSVFKDDLKISNTMMWWLTIPKETAFVLLASGSPQSIQGFFPPDNGKNLLFIVEQAGSVRDEIGEIAEGSTVGEENFLWVSGGGGRREGFFYDALSSRRDAWETIKVGASDRISKKKMAQYAEIWGVNSGAYKTRILGEFVNA